LGLTDAFPWKDYGSFIDWMLQDTAMSFDELCEKGVITGTMRYNKFSDEGFPTPSGKAELYSRTLQTMGVSPLPEYREPPVSPVSDPDTAQQYPLILTTGSKPMCFFHSEHRQIPSLRKRNPDPLLEIHPDTAGSLTVRAGDWVWVETPHGRVKMRAKLFEGIAQEVVGAQPSWWFPEAPAPEHGWKESNVNILIGEMEHDPDNGSESLRSVLCKVYRVEE
jgi:anaerobic selenocysteine-containing dehydrogenase